MVIDCRFSLADPGEGETRYLQGHIPGAHYLHLNRDLSGPVGEHGGRHPLPDPDQLAAKLASCGIGPDTEVIAYDDSRLAFAARLWWLMRSLGYRPPRCWLPCRPRASKSATFRSQVKAEIFTTYIRTTEKGRLLADKPSILLRFIKAS